MPRAPHVDRFLVLTEVVDGGRFDLSVVETLPDAQHLPLATRAFRTDGVTRVLFRCVLRAGEGEIEVFSAVERVVEQMNRMHLALEANTPQEVFDYLWSMEQIETEDRVAIEDREGE